MRPGSRADLAAEMAAEAAVLERELGEVELLLGQVRQEAQRHEAPAPADRRPLRGPAEDQPARVTTCARLTIN